MGKKRTVNVNGPKIKQLFEDTGKSMITLANQWKMSDKSLQRMARGIPVGEHLVDQVAKKFQLNVSDLIIKDKEQVEDDFFSGVYLGRVHSMSQIYNDNDFKLSRINGNSSCQLSHKYYHITNNEYFFIDEIKSVLGKIFEPKAVKSSVLSSAKGLNEELDFLANMRNSRSTIENLENKRTGVYYGHYFYRGIELRQDSDDLYNEFDVLYPMGKRIEVICFYEIDNKNTLPEVIKIFPDTGYSEDELKNNYIKQWKEFFKDYENENWYQSHLSMVKNFIDYHSKKKWLEVPNFITQPDDGMGYEGLPSGMYFIHLDKNADTKTHENFEIIKKSLKHVFLEGNENIPRYEDIVEEVNMKEFEEKIFSSANNDFEIKKEET